MKRRYALIGFLALSLWAQNTPAENSPDPWDLIAQERYYEVIQLAHQSPQTDREFLLALAFAYRSVDSLTTARRIYRNLLEQDPTDLDARLGLALVLAWSDSLEASLAEYRKVLKADPTNLEALKGIATVLGWKGEIREALRYLGQAKLFHPGEPEVYAAIGQIYLYIDDLDAAFQAYQTALKLDGENPEYYLKAAQIAEWQEDFKRALALYDQALKLAPDHPEALQGRKRVREALAFQVSLDFSEFREIDSAYRGTYREARWILRKTLNRIARAELRGYFSANRREDPTDTVQTPLLLLYPKLILRPFARFRLDMGLGYDFAKREVPGFVMAAHTDLPFLRVSLFYEREILEPARYILAEGWKGQITLRSLGPFEIRGEYSRGRIPENDSLNTRRAFSASLIAQVLRQPLDLKLSYGYSDLSYRWWSPYYFSPDTFRTHTLGVMAYRAFGKFYLYGEYFYARGPEGLRTHSASLEGGVGNLYLSWTWFDTSLGYRNHRVRLGYGFTLF